MGRSRTVWLWAITAALAGFLFGFDTAVISGAEQAIQRVWSMSDALHGLAISSALWGTVVGALAGSIPADRYGRRPTLIGIGVLYALSAFGTAFAWNPSAFMLFRFLGGVGIGLSSVTTPAYISEIFPNAARARGQAVGSGTHWVMAALLTRAKPLMMSSLAPAVIFLLFFVMMVFQLLFVQFLMVETRGQPLETVSHGLERN